MELFDGLTDVTVTHSGDDATVKMGSDTFTLHHADSRGEFTVLEPNQTGWLIYGTSVGGAALIRWEGKEKRFNKITDAMNAKLKLANKGDVQILPVIMVSKDRGRDDVLLRVASIPGNYRVRIWRDDKTDMLQVGKLTKCK